MSNDYWSRRQAQRMFEYMEEAEKAADEIAKLYLEASVYLNQEMDRIFDRFRSRYHLPEADVRLLLSRLQDGDSLKELKRLLQETQGEDSENLLTELEAPAYRARIENLQLKMNQIDSVMRDVYHQEQILHTDFYAGLAQESYYKSVFDIQKRAGCAFSFSFLSTEKIERVINSRWSGMNYSERIWKNTDRLAKELKKELLLSLVTGRTNRETAAVISDRFAVGAGKARRLVRTESCYLLGHMQAETYRENGVENYIFVATLELRTSEICRALDGKRFKVAQQEPGKNYPPMHPWCRSTTISDMTDEELAQMRQRARDPVNGEVLEVPENMTYQEWYQKYVEGNPEAELQEKMIKSRSSDRSQHERYQRLLGKDVPERLDDFQRMKYTDPERWKYTKLRYDDERLKIRLRSDSTGKIINSGRQGKHIKEHQNFIKGRSYLTITEEQAQELVNRYAGTGQIIRNRAGGFEHKERVIVKDDIAVYVDLEGNETPTNAFIIHYSDKGTHIVPARGQHDTG